MRTKKTIEQLRAEKEALEQLLKDRTERRQLERDVKQLKSQVKPSKLQRVTSALIFTGAGIVAGAKAFDRGLEDLEKAMDEADKPKATKRRERK